jgi:hypothetical protein
MTEHPNRPDRLVALLEGLGRAPLAAGGPATVDLVPAVLGRLEPRAEVAAARRRRRRWRLLAVAVPAVLLTGCMAIPATRTAVLDLLHLNGLVVRQGPVPPSVGATRQPTGAGQIGVRTTLGAAQAAAGGRVLVPTALGAPAQVWRDGVLVDLVYEDAAGNPTWVVTEVTAPSRPLLEKIVGMGATAQPVSVGGDSGVYVRGPQELLYLGADGTVHDVDSELATASLIWEHDGVTVRLQGDGTKDELVAVAASMR